MHKFGLISNFFVSLHVNLKTIAIWKIICTFAKNIEYGTTS